MSKNTRLFTLKTYALSLFCSFLLGLMIVPCAIEAGTGPMISRASQITPNVFDDRLSTDNIVLEGDYVGFQGLSRIQSVNEYPSSMIDHNTLEAAIFPLNRLGKEDVVLLIRADNQDISVVMTNKVIKVSDDNALLISPVADDQKASLQQLQQYLKNDPKGHVFVDVLYLPIYHPHALDFYWFSEGGATFESISDTRCHVTFKGVKGIQSIGPKGVTQNLSLDEFQTLWNKDAQGSFKNEGPNVTFTLVQNGERYRVMAKLINLSRVEQDQTLQFDMAFLRKFRLPFDDTDVFQTTEPFGVVMDDARSIEK